MTNDELLHKWVEQTITSEELALFKTRPEYSELTELYSGTADLQPPIFDQESMLQTILSSDKSRDSAEPVATSRTQATIERTIAVESRGRRQWLRIAIAACVLAIPAYFLMMSQNTMYAEAIAGEVESGILPDLSNYVLTGPSTLSFKKGVDGSRNVNLDGQATFKVERGAPFIVTTPTGIVEVLGTAFEVVSHDGELAVACTHGKVAVTSLGSQIYKETLVANERMHLFGDGSSITWKVNNTKLKNIELDLVLSEMSKKYALDFDTGVLDLSEKLSCNFANDNLELALKTILAPVDLKYSLTDNKVTLTK